MKLWGGLLPFVGFRSIKKCDDPQLWRFANLPATQLEVDVFEIEWFGFGMTFLKRINDD